MILPLDEQQFSAIDGYLYMFIRLILPLDMDLPSAIVTHKYLKIVAVIRQIRQQSFFYVELHAEDLKLAVAASMDRLSDPTDRPFDGASSTHNTSPPVNRHDPTALGNETGLIW